MCVSDGGIVRFTQMLGEGQGWEAIDDGTGRDIGQHVLVLLR